MARHVVPLIHGTAELLGQRHVERPLNGSGPSYPFGRFFPPRL